MQQYVQRLREREKETGQVQRSSRPPRLLQLAMLYRNVSWGWYTGCWSPRSAVRWLPPRPPSKCQSVNSPLSRLLGDETLLVSLCKTYCFDAFNLIYGLCKCDATWILHCYSLFIIQVLFWEGVRISININPTQMMDSVPTKVPNP